MRSVASILMLAPLALPAPAPNVECQLLASEPGTVSQTVDGTKVTVTYHRPRARGRTGLFGTRIRWGHTWTPGANMATRLDVSKDVTIEGRQVPKGAYSVWIVVTPGTWEMLLDRDTARFHTQPPKQGDAQVRFQVSREKSWTRPCIPLNLATATGYSAEERRLVPDGSDAPGRARRDLRLLHPGVRRRR